MCQLLRLKPNNQRTCLTPQVTSYTQLRQYPIPPSNGQTQVWGFTILKRLDRLV